MKILINHHGKVPKVDQIILGIKRDIEKGVLQANQRLLSVSAFSKMHKIARDTVEKAYRRLQEEGYIVAVSGKGNFVAEQGSCKVLKILLVFNKLSSYKKEIYHAFINALGTKARVDLQLHHYNPELLKEIISGNLSSYHYFVIMPHFHHNTSVAEYEPIFKNIPSNSLMLLDKDLFLEQQSYMSIYQDFKQDIYEALLKARHLFEKYESLTIIFPEFSHHPVELLDGVKQFCREFKKKYQQISRVSQIRLKPGQAFITLTESELADLIKKIRSTSFEPGKDIGILSFNETVLKELLDITVITSDFSFMGKTAASLILDKRIEQIRNPSKLIIRKSL